jgi:hypothetical protein
MTAPRTGSLTILDALDDESHWSLRLPFSGQVFVGG